MDGEIQVIVKCNPDNPKTKIQGGCIQLIIGPMFAGKTLELLRRMETEKKEDLLLIKSKKDNRYSSHEIVTHCGKRKIAQVYTKLMDAREMAMNYAIIGIDEGQFFDDLIQFSEEMAEEGKIIIVAALDGDYQKKPFGQICQMVPRSEIITKLYANCQFCRFPASFTKRISNDKEIEVIGGTDKYVATCRKCFNSDVNMNKLMNKPEYKNH